MTRALFRADNETTDERDVVGRISQEVLMSYRLLFGQKQISRKAGRAELERLKCRDPHYDPLLDVLCTHNYGAIITKLPASLWPVSCRDIDGTLQEVDSYSAQDDFPIFGPRLLKLQGYNLRRQPSKFRDLWRDRRNPLQWYTFWAVLIIGGLGIILSAVQVGVATAQLILAIQVAHPERCKC